MIARTAGLVLVSAALLAAAPATRPAAVRRPPPPTRDPNAPGFVAARPLADGIVPPADADGNFVLGPAHPRSPDLALPDGAPRGTVTAFTMASADSRLYPGVGRDPQVPPHVDPADPAKLVVTTRPAAYARTVTVYVPAGYVAGTVAPLLVGADGPDKPLFTALDAGIAARRLPPMVAVSIGNGGGDGQGSERGLEYDAVSGRYAEFVEHEVLPQVAARCHVTLTHDPDARATMGCSSGASAALAMAWFHPEWYRRVLSYSGTFVNQQYPPDPATPHGAWTFHEHLIPESPRKPLRLWLEVGDRDLLNPNAMRDGMHDWVAANEAMATALAVKGYPYQFVFARNAGHCDAGVKQQTLPEALAYVWHGYAMPEPLR